MDQAPVPTPIQAQVFTQPSRFSFKFKIIILSILVFLILVLVGVNFALNRYGRFWEKQPSANNYSQLLARKTGFLKYSNPGISDQDIKKQADADWAKQAVVEKEAKKLGIAVSEAEITAEIDNRAQKAGGKAALEQTLQLYGWSQADLREKVRTDLLEKKLKDKLTTWRDYQILVIRYDNPLKNEVSQEERKRLAQDVANQALARVKSGEDLSKVYQELLADAILNKKVDVQGTAEVTRIQSNISKKFSDSPLQKFIFSLKKGQLSEVFTGNGYFAIAFCQDANDGTVESFENWLKGKREN